MCRALSIAALSVLFPLMPGGGAWALVPPPLIVACFPNEVICPPQCSFVLSGASNPCQYVFRSDGEMDELVVNVTLRNDFEEPVPDCEMSVELAPDAGTLAFCSCEELRQVAVSDDHGAAEFRFALLGGRGTLEIRATTHCYGDLWLADETIEFTSPDLSGSCELDDAVGVIDLGIWAQGLPPAPYVKSSDFNCDSTVNVIDLGYWVSGLGKGCSP